jgi:nucleotide-binding universal stress UspA family protein
VTLHRDRDHVVDQQRDRGDLGHARAEVLPGHDVRAARPGFKTGVLTEDETTAEANAKVAASIEVLTQAGVKAHGEVRNTIFGLAVREIVNDAIEVDADVIVMGSRGRGDIAGLLLGSTAHKVIHLSDRPVLVVR